jgi:hypothetical protein
MTGLSLIRNRSLPVHRGSDQPLGEPIRPRNILTILSFLCATLPSGILAATPCPLPWALNGTASNNSGTVTLTQFNAGHISSAWNPAPLTLTSNFDMTFQVFLGTVDVGGSDGMMFALQSAGLTALGDGGSYMGYATGPVQAGIQPSVAVEIDTYYNFELAEPTYDHLAVNENAERTHNGAAAVQASASDPNVEDGTEHSLRLVWDATTTTLSVYFDGSLRLTYTKNIVDLIFGGNPVVTYGFTSSNGGGSNVHYFYQADPCPPLPPTATATPTNSPTPTLTPTVTATPTVTSTPPPEDVFWLSRNISRPGVDAPELFARVLLNDPGSYSLAVYNSAGEMVRVLRKGQSASPWSEDIPWDGTNEKSEPVASGVYLFRLEGKLTIELAKVLLVR